MITFLVLPECTIVQVRVLRAKIGLGWGRARMVVKKRKERAVLNCILQGVE
jgi:hypothetical protein